jgi:hypothetical protein
MLDFYLHLEEIHAVFNRQLPCRSHVKAPSLCRIPLYHRCLLINTARSYSKRSIGVGYRVDGAFARIYELPISIHGSVRVNLHGDTIGFGVSRSQRSR